MSTKCAPLWREAHFQVKVRKTHQRRSTFGSWDVDKVRAAVARTTFPNQNLQSTPASEHFWKLGCRQSARHCGAKHISKSKCAKHTSVGAFLQVVMSKKCAPLWREAHFQVKVRKTHQRRSMFGSWDVDKVRAIVARSTFPSRSVQSTPASEHSWKLGCRQSAHRGAAKHFQVKMREARQRRSMFGSWDVDKVRAVVARSISKSKCPKHTSVGALLEVGMSTKCVQLWREQHFQIKTCKAHQRRSTFGSWDVDKVHAVAARSTCPSQNAQGTIALHYATLHYITRRSTTLHSATLHSTTLHYTTPSTLHDITLYYSRPHYTPLHPTTLQYTTRHFTTLHCSPLRYATLHYATLH